MRKEGVLYTCSRCGREKFVEKESAQNLAAPVGWGAHRDRPLCPTCADLYYDMLNRFFAPEVQRKINLEG